MILVANFLRLMPWRTEWLAVPLAGALARAGNDVEVIADGFEAGVDRALAAAVGQPVKLEAISPMRTHLGSNPRHFVREIAKRTAGAEVISLTGLVPAERWLPLDEPPTATGARIVRELSPLSAALELAHHPWLSVEWLAWRRARARGARHGWKPLQLGDPAKGGLGVVSIADTAVQRDTARTRLGVGDRGCVAVSAADDTVVRLRPVFEALASLGNTAPDCLVLGHKARSIMSLAARCGVLSRVKPLGLTRRVGDVLAAVDGVVALPASGPRVGGGRWIADAVARGLPVAADTRSEGTWLLNPDEIVHGDWAGGIRRLASGSPTPPRPAQRLGIDSLAERLLAPDLCSAPRG